MRLGSILPIIAATSLAASPATAAPASPPANPAAKLSVAGAAAAVDPAQNRKARKKGGALWILAGLALVGVIVGVAAGGGGGDRPDSP
ncbi:hypothetical protein [Sphingomonas sp.]|uniref:hypothetical protein n=1 Tax=Sphingomonas sp. TaxID=28214 RepID=UPI002BF08D08|nr:hypothetical protein [Sphingomonas sp.]HWK36225.1 hypothetical protein [Sphingomonas sp.]